MFFLKNTYVRTAFGTEAKLKLYLKGTFLERKQYPFYNNLMRKQYALHQYDWSFWRHLKKINLTNSKSWNYTEMKYI